MLNSAGKKRGRNATSLAVTNPFSFDDDVEFSEAGHIYRVHGRKAEMSVTSLVKMAFPASADFNGRAICETNLARWRTNASNRYHAVVADIPDDEEATAAVMAIWDRNRDLGTLAHKAVELTLNNELVPNDALVADVKKELDQFMMFHDRQTLAGWKVLRSELSLYHKRTDGTTIAGQIDILYRDNTGKLRVVDIKRSEKVLSANAHNFGKFGAGVAAEIKDTDHYRYSLQCWLYSCMLWRLTDAEMGAPLLVQVHPDLDVANVIPCADLQSVAEQLLDGPSGDF